MVPDDYAADPHALADQLQKIADEASYEFGTDAFAEIDVRFYRVELGAVIKLLRGGSNA